MNRRSATFLIAAVMAAPSVAFAQIADPSADNVHAASTLAVGSVALETSKLAQSKAKDPWVKKFADYEVAEQTTIAEILKSMGAKPADRNEKQTATIDNLKKSNSFDADFLAAQIDGHNELLKIQDDYISRGKTAANVNLAKLARGQIKEHIDLLETIKKNLKV